MMRSQPRRTRVLFVNTRSALGADVAVHLTIIRNLARSRCEVTLATNSASSDVTTIREIVGRCPETYLLELPLGVELSGLSGYKKIAAAARSGAALVAGLVRLAWLVRRRGIDVIHSTDRPRDALLATVLARVTGRRSLLHLHIKWCPNMGRATEWGVAHADGVLAISDFVRRSLVEGGIAESRIHTVLNATDTVDFDPERVRRGALREKLGVSCETPLVGLVGRFIVWKGHQDLLEAMRSVFRNAPNARLVFVGKEDDYSRNHAEDIRRRVAELGLGDHVLWAGWHDDMPEVFADLDVVCVPSFEEPFGLVATEAMAMQRAVIGYASGALPEIVENGVDGVLVPPRDTKALGEAIADLLADPTRRADMGCSARRKVMDRFTPRRQADEVADVYEQMAFAGTKQSRRTRG